MEHLSLLAGGQEHSRAVWEKAAADVLRKAGRMKDGDPDSLVWRKLTRTTLDGIEIAPLGTVESVTDVPPAGVPGAPPYTRGAVLSRPTQGWDIRTQVGDPDVRIAAAAALDDLENGGTSLWLALGDGGIALSDLPAVLEKVYVDLAPVVLDAPSDPVAAAEAFAAVLADRGVSPAPGTSLGGDPVSARVRQGAPSSADDDVAVRRLADLAGEHGTLALTVDGTAVHDIGATDAQELGYTLGVGVHYLRTLAAHGLDARAAASLLEFRYAVTDEQLTAIAKLRAARRLWHRALELSGAGDAPGQVQHAVTSRPMTTKHDPWVNLLRGTVAAFAAGVGGATSVTVLPFDAAVGLPDSFSRRIARNTSSLLIHEAHVAGVCDPAGGAYAIERLTDDLARSGWAAFQELEAEGGVVASLELSRGGLLDRITHQAVEPRQRQVATRRRPITGVSEFPNLEERLPERRPFPDGAPSAARYAADFEAMRDKPAPTSVFLATLGPVAQHTARAGFAANLLAAGGVLTVPAGATSGVEDLLAAYADQPVVCLAGSDAAYAAWGADAATALREAGARYVVLAGKPGDRTVRPDLVDDSCAVGVDALAFLTRVRQELGR